VTVTISSPELEAAVRQQAAAAGLAVDDYVEQLITTGLEHLAQPGASLSNDRSESEFAEVQSALDESLKQIERNEDRPAREVFAELRAKYGRATTV
jgi:hypothetical protein